MPRRKSHGVRTLQPVRTNELTPTPKVATHTHGTQTAVAATHACDRRPTQTLQPSTSSQPFQRRTAGEKKIKNPPAPADLCAWLLGYGSSSDWLAVCTEPERPSGSGVAGSPTCRCHRGSGRLFRAVSTLHRLGSVTRHGNASSSRARIHGSAAEFQTARPAVRIGKPPMSRGPGPGALR